MDSELLEVSVFSDSENKLVVARGKEGREMDERGEGD